MQLDTMLTVDEYARLPRDSSRLELSRGLLVHRPHPSVQHAETAARIYDAFCRHAARAGGRVVFHGHFLLQEEPPTVRGPDIAFLPVDHPGNATAENVWRGAPDVAIEILAHSTDGARAELLEKTFEYLDAGARQVWLVDLTHRSVAVYDSASEPRIYRNRQVIRGGVALPGFAPTVSSLLG